jgi:hemoglobin-like flavoprotein
MSGLFPFRDRLAVVLFFGGERKLLKMRPLSLFREATAWRETPMTIEQSVHQLLAQKETVIRLFYDRFLAQYPEVREYFAAIDLDQQAITLTMALVMIENNFSHEYPATQHYLRVLGHRHHLMGIPTDLFPKFCDCLLQTLEKFHGTSWDAELSAQWRGALEKASQTMLEGYRKPYVY